MPKLIDLNGVGPVLANACVEHGFRSVADIASARESALVAVPGVSNTRAKQLIEGAKALLNGGVSPADATTANANAEHAAPDSPPERVRVKTKKKGKKKKANKKDSKKKSKKSTKKQKKSKSKKKKAGEKKKSGKKK